jgi:predicted Zn-dependent peptidase
MKKAKMFLALVVLLLSLAPMATAQKTYSYKTYPNDPLQVREYTLDNGLKVYMSVYKDAPRVQTFIAVRAGSKNDPHETTGLAHYLEHIMFKGTHKLGTTNWAAEEPILKQIEDLFEVYRMFDDQTTRSSIYHKIDSLSYEASKLAVANEYDKAMSAIGSTGTNAFTSNDYTMYVENIPSNEIDTWCELQADRFQNLVLRLFHTELETIYEEKNMSLTKDGRKSSEAMLAALFPHHPYGTQTTLGEAEHLKNPSMRNIKNFVKNYYVPNNICIAMSGDFDPDEAIKIIDKYWGNMQPGKVPEFKYENEQPITSPITKTVTGLDPENITLAYRINAGNGSHDIILANLLAEVLNNGKCGLIDVNINQAQKCLGAYASVYSLNDYASFMFGGRPNAGQSLDDIKAMLFEQIKLVKQGQFSDWMLEAAINNMKLSIMKQAESNRDRASQMAYAFVEHRDWSDVCNEINDYSRVTKQDLVDFANKVFLDSNYVVVYKRQGTPDPVTKVAKPPITPIEVGRDRESDYLKEIKARQVKPIEPVFVDYNKDMQKAKLGNGSEILYVQNTENKTFNLIYYFDFGSYANKGYTLASNLIDYLGTSKHTAEQLNEEFYRLACNWSYNVNNETMSVSISGLSENMQKAMALVEEIFSDAQPNEQALKDLVERSIKSRTDSKTNQQTSYRALNSYAMYGENSSFLTALSDKEMRAYTATQLTDLIHNLFGYKHRVLYYGPETMNSLQGIVNADHQTPKKLAAAPKFDKFHLNAVKDNTVYFLDYNANQTYLFEYFRDGKYDLKLRPQVNIYNEYFGGSMNAIVFQEMREKRSLAYSAQSSYNHEGRQDGYFYNQAVIATQNDKLLDALKAFNGLFDEMPEAQANFDLAKNALISNIRTARTTKMGIINSYLSDEKMGYKENPNKMLFAAYPKMTMQDIINFNNKHVKGQKKYYMVLGRESDMNFNELGKYGKVVKVKMDQLFNY